MEGHTASVSVALALLWIAGRCSGQLSCEHQQGNVQLPYNRLGQLFAYIWPRDPGNSLSEYCCGDVFQCESRQASCLRCGPSSCDPLSLSMPGCPSGDCVPFGKLCDGLKDCENGADEQQCSEILDTFQVHTRKSIDTAQVVVKGLSLQACAAYCFYHLETCPSFSYSDSVDPEANTSSKLQVSFGRRTYISDCRIGCTNCGARESRLNTHDLYRPSSRSYQLSAAVKKAPGGGAQPSAAPPPGAGDSDRLPRYPDCGRRALDADDAFLSSLVDRVANAEESRYGEFPWQVQIEVFNRSAQSYQHHCGGVLISRQFVLTAAHCMTGGDGDYQLWLGQYEIGRADEAEQVFGIKARFNHPDYQRGTKENDLSVLLLNSARGPPVFSRYVQPACLIRPDSPAPTPGTNCWISGWGLTSTFNPEVSRVLRGGEVPLVSDSFCASPEAYGTAFHPSKMICAGYVAGGGVDACQGDSGGGLVCETEDHVWQVVGVVSFGAQCAQAVKPGIYTELQAYYGWILEMMRLATK